MRARGFLGLLIVMSLISTAPGEALAKKKRRRGGASRPIPALTKDGLPNVQAKGAIVVDLDTGEEVYARDADTPRPIASTTKIFVAMVVRKKGIALDGETTITDDDQKRARGGAKSRLLVGRRFRNIDLLRAMLIASDNRACTAVARAVGMTPEQLIEAMNAEARRMGLKKTKFTDPSGLRGNESTPREMALALREAMKDDVLRDIMTTHQVEVRATDGGEVVGEGKRAKRKSFYAVHYNNTNVSLRTSRFQVLGGKTGYTDAARYCLVIAGKLAGKRYVMTFLGAEGELTRFADFNHVAEWIEQGRHVQHASARSERKPVGALADPPPPPVTPRLAP